jgi:hypothetical protein
MSNPVEKARSPAPRQSTTFTASSASARSSAAIQAANIASLKAFILSGRFSVIVATPSATS